MSATTSPRWLPSPELMLIALLLLAGCSAPEPPPADAGSGAGADAGAHDAGLADAGLADAGLADAGLADAGADAGTTLDCVPGAAGPVDHFAIGLGDGIDLDSAPLPLSDGRVLVVFERYDPAFTTGRLLASVLSADALTPTTPEPLSLGTEAFVAAPAIVPVGGTAYLYFVTDESLQGVPGLARSRIDGATFSARESVPAIPGIDWLLSWPRFVDLPDGGVAVAFHDGAGRPSYASSANGLQFGAPAVVDPRARAMAKVQAFADGTLAYTYQSGQDPMMSYVRLGTGAGPPSWSAPTAVSALTNVHDTSAVRRLDGGMDLYYVSTEGAAGFRLYRRALRSDGSLGAEQQLSFDPGGEVSKPNVVRLRDCRLLVTYAEITQRDASQAPIRQRLGGMVLVGDAPAP